MKRIFLTIALTLVACAIFAQTPYKILNRYVWEIWQGDTAKTEIWNYDHTAPDSLVYYGNESAYFMWDSIFIPPLKNGVAGDSLLLFLHGETGWKDTVDINIVRYGTGSFWKLTGNAGTVDGTNFIGTTDGAPINFRQNNQHAGRIDSVRKNVMLGYEAGNTTSTGYENVIIGHKAMPSFTNNGKWNVAIGYLSLNENLGGIRNTAVGWESLKNNDTGAFNTAIGNAAMFLNDSGSYNVGVGNSALYLSKGSYNTAIGHGALYNNDKDSNNIGVGHRAGYWNDGNSNRLYINSIERTDENQDFWRSIIYGIMDDDSSAQYLYLNGNVNVGAFNEGYLLPFLDGNNGDVLTTDGAGTVTWQPPGGGGAALWDSTTTAGNLVIHPIDTVNMDVAFFGDRVFNAEQFKSEGSYAFYGSGGTPKTDYNGILCYWNAAKGAFRAGNNTFGYFFADANVGTYSAGFNDMSTASGSSSFAANNGAATSFYTAAFGKGNANNWYAFSCGQDCRSQAYTSFSHGWETQAGSYCEAVFGYYSIQTTGNASAIVSTDMLFHVGNGTGTFGTGKFNDAFRLNKDASGWFKTDSATSPIIEWNTDDSIVNITGTLYVKGKTTANSVQIDTTSAVRLNGATIVWDDVRAPSVQLKSLGAVDKPDFNTTYLTLDFPKDTTEQAGYIFQLPHDFAEGHDSIYPHIHYRKEHDTIPSFRMQYQWVNGCDTFTNVWTNLDIRDEFCTYTTGTQHSKMNFPGIPASGKEISSILMIKIYRLTTCIYPETDVMVIELDVHYPVNAMGSNTPISKD